MVNGICLGHINRCILRVYLNIAIQCHACSIIESCNVCNGISWDMLEYVEDSFFCTAISANSQQLKIIPSSVGLGCLSGIVCRNCCKKMEKMLSPRLLVENPTDLRSPFFSSCNYVGICCYPRQSWWFNGPSELSN